MDSSDTSNIEEVLTRKLVNNWIYDELESIVEPERETLRREPKTEVDYWDSTWGRWLNDKSIHNPNSKIARIVFMLHNS